VSFLTGKPLLTQTLVVESGHAYRLKVDVVNSEVVRGSSLAVALLRHIQTTITQMTLDIACARHHAIEQQLCRWFLDCLDRTPRHEFTMTQELLSHILGVRRESVTAAAGHLKLAGVIDYYRGRLVLRDRAGLEARVCGCYEVARQAHSMGHTNDPVGHAARQGLASR
jgi:CRP-like cAMP-binding protein